MLTLDKSHTINIAKYRLRINSPRVNPADPVLLLDSGSEAGVTDKKNRPEGQEERKCCGMTGREKMPRCMTGREKMPPVTGKN